MKLVHICDGSSVIAVILSVLAHLSPVFQRVCHLITAVTHAVACFLRLIDLNQNPTIRGTCKKIMFIVHIIFTFYHCTMANRQGDPPPEDDQNATSVKESEAGAFVPLLPFHDTLAPAVLFAADEVPVETSEPDISVALETSSEMSTVINIKTPVLVESTCGKLSKTKKRRLSLRTSGPI